MTKRKETARLNSYIKTAGIRLIIRSKSCEEKSRPMECAQRVRMVGKDGRK